jgi:hypothetical protein
MCSLFYFDWNLIYPIFKREFRFVSGKAKKYVRHSTPSNQWVAFLAIEVATAKQAHESASGECPKPIYAFCHTFSIIDDYSIGTTNIARAAYSSLFEKIENDTFLKFEKNVKLNLQVDNVMIYNHANFQAQIPYI